MHLNNNPLLPPSRVGRQPLQARSISGPISAYLQDLRKGSVLATFHRSCYLNFGERIIAVVASELGNGPLNVVLEIESAYSFQAIPVGEPAIATPKIIAIGTDLQISFAHAHVWVPTIAPWATRPRALEANLDLCENALRREAPKGSFAQALPISPMTKGNDMEEVLHRQASEAMKTLVSGLSERDLITLARGAQQLAGLGLGLTPSGDDVLTGVFIALSVLPPPNAEQLRSTVLAATAGRIPRISAAYLHAAAQGEASEPWHDLLAVLPDGQPSAITSAVRVVMAVGETSGADMLAGFLLAQSAMGS